jgi:hypothetical protein
MQFFLHKIRMAIFTRKDMLISEEASSFRHTLQFHFHLSNCQLILRKHNRANHKLIFMLTKFGMKMYNGSKTVRNEMKKIKMKIIIKFKKSFIHVWRRNSHETGFCATECLEWQTEKKERTL